MSRRIVSVVVCALSLLFAGCAFDEHGRGHYADRGGSMKDTHLRTSKSYKTPGKYDSQRKTRTAYRHRPVKRISMSAEEAARKFSAVKNVQSEKAESDDDKSGGVKVADKADGSQNSDPGNKKSYSRNSPAEKKSENKPVEVAKVKVEKQVDVQDGSASEEYFLEDQVMADTKEVVLPKNSKLPASRREKGLLAMHVQVPKDEAPKTRDFKPGIIVEDPKPFSVVKVYYATDRGLSGNKAPDKVYGSRRGAISYGSCDISIPKIHKMGEIEAPSIWRLEFRENEEKHVILKKVEPQKKTAFFNAVKKNIELSKGKNAFVFVHGYNIEFHEAAKRTAQMAHDLKFDGVPIFYSWPSKGTYKDYTRDEANIKWTQSNLKTFMRDFVQRSRAENIYLIAHSMGARALTGAVAELAVEMPSIRKRIKEVFLAAPDIDAEIFKRDIAPKLVKASKNITLYASADDKALRVSRTIHGQPRAGDAGNSLVVVKGIDTIDATGIDTSLFGHNYFAEAPSIISDILAIMHYGKRPRDRVGLIPVLAAEGQYWAFRKDNTMMINGTAAQDDEVREINH